jgi:hypothetical protein
VGTNLGETPATLLAKVKAAIVDPNDSRRQALEAIVRAVQNASTANPLQSALENLYPGSPPDQASVDRLISDLDFQKTCHQALIDWTSQEAVTSRQPFLQDDPSKGIKYPERLALPAPEVCMLSVTTPVTPDQAAALLAVDADVSFKEALRQIAAGNLTARASIGIEQIQQIAPDAELPTLANKKLTWHGPLRLEQAIALARWKEVSTFGRTFGALLAALKTQAYQETFTATDESPHPDELPPALQDHLQIGVGTVSWTGLNFDTDVELALLALTANIDYGPTFSAAVRVLLNDLQAATIRVDVIERDWNPRKRPGELLPGVLSIGEAQARFYGLMTRAECKDLQAGCTALEKELSGPDLAAVARLFADTTRAGLGSADLVVRARLGSAANRQSELDSTVV